MNTFSAVQAVRDGWATFMRRPLFFMGVSLAFFILYSLISSMAGPDERAELLVTPMELLFAIASFIVGVVVEMFLINFALAAHDHPESVQLSEGTSRLPFWQYAAVKVVTGVIVLAGLVLLIVPGIIAMLALMFSNYLVVDKGLSFVAAMKESYRITRRHWMQLFILLVVLVVLNIAGALLLFVGLIVTLPVSMLTMAHAYRTIEHGASELVPVTTA